MQAVANIYFVASPLQYLAASAIAEQFEAGGRQILVWYKPGVGSVVIPERWEAAVYMPWPRLEPLPGPFGRHRRLVENIEMVAALVGKCETLRIHSAVFDTEAINYFLRALPVACGAEEMTARILPDGVISIRRYPLSVVKRLLQHLKKVRSLVDPRLNYWRFAGDRIGSDAPFCDRIYVMPGFPHEYPVDKVVTLPPLVRRQDLDAATSQRKALVVGQPLVGAGLMSSSALNKVSDEIHDWLLQERFDVIEYKGHPKDPNLELCRDGYVVLQLDEPLETWMSKTHYDAVIGVRSSALMFARQIYSPQTKVVGFGWESVRFKSDAERSDMRSLFHASGILLR